ncbi:serine/threonine-protein kinase [Anatilimnocola floriformis]|uniref:serine/threonine-protein kinase n=1 Tax=Anatilimnocola floriformis TaxID=2948575 RepID=UPI0020C592F8|nr:serine/threonine-protein kinase [Anatilimnocola floriformis]
MSAAADRNLLFGILALQLDFITREQLIAGMQNWVLHKEQPLADLLATAGALSVQDRTTLEAVVERHLEKHGNCPQQSLAAVNCDGTVKQELTLFSDPHIDASLPHIGTAKPVASDRFATIAPAQANEARFQILRPHAEGGLGKVFVARDGELNREVALKEIQPHYANDQYARARFTVEAEITGRLEHPGIVPVYGLGTYADGRPYYAMRFIRGESLKEAIARYHEPQSGKTPRSERAVELRQLLGRFIDVCQAVQYAHDRGVLHRDLKPANVMLGKYGETLVVDWGLAKAEGKNIEPCEWHGESQLVPASGSEVEPTQMGTMVGTLQYMSPEQAIGRMDLLGPATDVFALGATLYHLLTGQAPYQGTQRDEVIAAVREATFPLPRQINKQVPPPLESICLKALEADPTRRYASAGDLMKDIERWMAEESVDAHHESFWERLDRWKRKRPNVVAGIRAALIIAILGSCFGALVMQGMNDRLATANADLEEACRRAYEGMKEANLERERSHSTTHFFAATLGKLQAGEDGRQIPAGTLLARAAEQADVEFHTDPVLKGRVLEMLTTALQGLGLADTTVALHERELLETKKHCQAHDPRIRDCVNDLANAYLAAGRDSDAIAILEKHCETPPAPKSREQLATPVKYSADKAAAQPGGQHLAALHAEIERHDSHPEELLLDLSDPLTTLDRHAQTHLAKGQWDQALPLKEAALRMCTTQSTRTSSATCARLDELARLCIHAGRASRAVELADEEVQILSAKKKANPIVVCQAKLTDANAYCAAGRAAEAIALLEAIIPTLEARKSECGLALLESRDALATAFRSVGRLTEARTLATQVYHNASQQLGGDHELTLAAAYHLTVVQVLCGDLEAATLLGEQTRDRQTRKFGADHPDVLATQLWLGAAKTKAGEYHAAEALLLQTHDMIETSSLGAKWQCEADCLRFLTELYKAWEQPAVARQWRAKLYAWQQENP